MCYTTQMEKQTKLEKALHLLFAKVPRVGGNLKPEDKICVEFTKRLIKATRFEDFPAVWFHVPNEFSGSKKPIFGMLQKAMGKVAGMSDYVFLWEDGNLCLEFKTEEASSKQSDKQEAVETWCKASGVPYRLARSADEAYAILKDVGLPDLAKKDIR